MSHTSYGGSLYDDSQYDDGTGDKLVDGIYLGTDIVPKTLTHFDDLNAVRMFLFNSVIEPKKYLFERQEGTFERPSFLIQSLGQSLVPKNAYWMQVEHNMVIQFFALNYVQAMHISNELMMQFGQYGRGIVLPYYDITQDPPVKIYDTHMEQICVAPENSIPVMGLRVSPETVIVDMEQEDHDVAERSDWNLVMTFRAYAPRVLYDVTQEKVIAEAKLTGFVTEWFEDC